MNFVAIDKYAPENAGAKTEATFSMCNVFLLINDRPLICANEKEINCHYFIDSLSINSINFINLATNRFFSELHSGLDPLDRLV